MTDFSCSIYTGKRLLVKPRGLTKAKIEGNVKISTKPTQFILDPIEIGDRLMEKTDNQSSYA